MIKHFWDIVFAVEENNGSSFVRLEDHNVFIIPKIAKGYSLPPTEVILRWLSFSQNDSTVLSHLFFSVFGQSLDGVFYVTNDAVYGDSFGSNGKTKTFFENIVFLNT